MMKYKNFAIHSQSQPTVDGDFVPEAVLLELVNDQVVTRRTMRWERHKQRDSMSADSLAKMLAVAAIDTGSLPPAIVESTDAWR